MKNLLLGCGLLIITSCSPLSPELIAALSKDNASFCANVGISGGAGALTITPAPVPLGGFGYGHLSFCRSNHDNAKLSMTPDGTISIEHGAE